MGGTDLSGDLVADGASAVEDVLAHYGVKGMKWGVRKAERHRQTAERSRRIAEGTASKKDKFDQVMGKGMGGRGGLMALRKPAAERQAARSEAKARGDRGKIRRAATKANVALNAGAKVIDEGEKKLLFLPQKNREEAASKTQARVLGEAAAINRSPQFKGKDLKKNPDLSKQYFDKVVEAAKKTYAEELNISRTQAWGDFLGVDMNRTTNIMRVQAAKDRIRHADEDLETLVELHFILDDLGQIKDITQPEKYVSHSLGEAELHIAHYGVKGMKWGIRKDRGSSGPQDVTVSQKKPGTRVKAEGGKRQPASEDAKSAAASRQKARASTTDALSNKELQDVVKRMQLEQQYSQLSAGRKSAGAKFVERLLGAGQDVAVSSVQAQMAYKVDTELSKRGKPVSAKSKYKFKED